MEPYSFLIFFQHRWIDQRAVSNDLQDTPTSSFLWRYLQDH